MIHILYKKYLLSSLSSIGSGTHGPALHVGPKNLAEAFILDSAKDISGSHNFGTKVDSKYCWKS